MSPKLKATIEKFRRLAGRHEWETSTTADALDRCFPMSVGFYWFCVALGLRRVNLQVYFKPKLPFTVPGASAQNLKEHYACSVGLFVVDWTARQFWTEADYPMVVHLGNIGKYWDY